MTSSTYAARLPVTGRPALVVGGDQALLGVVSALVEAGAQVTVVAHQVAPAVEDLAGRGALTWVRRDWSADDLDDVWLVVASREDPALARECELRRLWLQTEAATTGAGDDGAARRVEHGARGSVTLVGGGPGDPGLLTLSGLKALEAADVVVADRLAPLAVLADLANHPTIVDVSKIPGGRATAQERINALLVEHASAGAHVVRLKGGDPFVFGRGGEEALACAEAHIPVRVVPGVTSAVAAPELAGVPVTHRGASQGFTVVSGHLPPGHPGSTVDYAALAGAGTTIVLLMAVANLDAIARELLDAGMPPDTACAVVADAALPSQHVVRAPLEKVAAEAVREGIRPPAVTVIGEVGHVGESVAEALGAGR